MICCEIDWPACSINGLALELEAANRNIQGGSAGEAKVHATRNWSHEQTSGGSSTRCDICGGSNHSVATCKVPRDVNCLSAKGWGTLLMCAGGVTGKVRGEKLDSDLHLT